MTDLGPLFASAALERDLGMLRSADHADRDTPGWTEQALEALRDFALRQSEPFTIEYARAQLERELTRPPDLRAWGAVTLKAIRTGVLVRTGEFAPRASSHNSPTMTYRSGPAVSASPEPQLTGYAALRAGADL